jgi:hypothetical protein
MEHENKVVEASLLGMGRIAAELLHPSPTPSQDAWVGLDEVETALMYQPTRRDDN